ncbi:MAG: 1-deoxy-D-xylulose-5-phosphate reductoisomerase [Clostridia bacterium]|nr:1-deoxy-D-xylulose-5-phosphate reductoisomerase [Clostridia bacterium]
MQKLAVFGSTGSIGRQALSVAALHSDRFKVSVIAARSNVELVSKQIEEFVPDYVGMYDEAAAQTIKSRFPHVNIVAGGEVNALCALDGIDTVVNGVSGFAGLFPLMSALESGKRVALANKESIVCAHKLVDRALKESGGSILPVDSEQSAIFQCLTAGRKEDVKSLILTASGGMFRDFTREQLETVTPEMTLAHPTWNMGKKITVDSSSLFNKGLEVMEAGWLFGFEPDSVRVFIHPQSIVHSMVEYTDGAVVAQLARPDMRLAIQYALTYPERTLSHISGVSPAMLSGLEFFEPDRNKFPALDLAYEAFREGESLPIAYNCANEVAVERFLAGEMKFTDIPRCVEYAMRRITKGKIETIDDILCLDKQARVLAGEFAP